MPPPRLNDNLCSRGRRKFLSVLVLVMFCIPVLGTLKAESSRSQFPNTGYLEFDRALPDNQRTVPAELVREAVFRHHRISVTNAIIEGRLDCQNAVLDGNLVFTNCRFRGDVDFGFASFRQSVSFSGSEFDRGVRLEFANAAQNVDLSRTKFHGGRANFSGLRCEGMILGTGVQLGEKAQLSFDFCDVRKGFVFTSSRFDGAFSCTKAHLQGFIAFVAVNFKKNAFFGMTVFDGMVIFLPGSSAFAGTNTSSADPAGFDQDANFAMAEFRGYAVFSVDFRGWANFSGIRGDAELVFGIPSSVPVDWQLNQRTTFSQEAHFTGLDAKRLSFEKVEFNKCVDFSGMTVTEDVRFGGDHYEHSDRQMFSDCAIFRRARVGGALTFSGCGFGSEVDFDSANITGDLSFHEESNKREPPPIFGGTAYFERVRVDGNLTFDSRLFAKPLILKSANIGGFVSFRGLLEQKAAPVILKESVVFSGADIKKWLKAPGVTFDGPFECQSATLGAVDFRADPTNGLNAAVVNSDAFFSGSRLDWAFFDGTTFKKTANFDAMEIKREARFQSATFAGPLSFRATRCEGGLHFEGAHLNDASFRDTVVKSLAFSDSFGSSQVAQFNGNIDLRGCLYDRIDVDWNRLIKRIEPFDRQAYAQLQKALNAVGESDAAAEVYQKRLVREVGEHRSRWATHIWAWISAKPSQIALASGLVVSVGWLLFFLWPGSFETKDLLGLSAAGPAQPLAAATPKTATRRIIERVGSALALSVRSFIPFETAVGAHLAPRSPFGTTIALIIRLCGWALLAMLIAAASGLFRASP